MPQEILLGNEAVALGAWHAGISGSYAYPGTPSTEITEFLQTRSHGSSGFSPAWCTNEKTAYEAALGVSFAGRRALVSMKHVGLNVAADPFINSALVPIRGGLVLAVADDPGMHSSQNEQDSRFYADFAHILCLEPADQQQAYDMTREAFDLSEHFSLPVMVRLVTRLAHSRAIVSSIEPRPENQPSKPSNPFGWILLPANARQRWQTLLDTQEGLRSYSEGSPYTRLASGDPGSEVGIITAGVARNYFEEVRERLEKQPAHLHIGSYPLPVENIRRLADRVSSLLILEDGFPMIERRLRGILSSSLDIRGKETGHLPLAGELDPDSVATALGLPLPPSVSTPQMVLPSRAPRLCRGCPHADSYSAIKKALESFEESVVAADVGCYTLGALPPYSAIESCVCMGASIGMARGASEAGLHPAIGVIGDSTFLHSGITALLDAAAADVDMTVVILDNSTVAMTGAQPTIGSPGTIERLVRATGVAEDHLHIIEAHPRKINEIANLLRDEIAHPGLSVVIATRECIEAAKKRKRRER